MNEILRITIFLTGSLFVLFNMRMLMKKRVNERIAVMWILGCLIVFIIAAFPLILNKLAHFVGVEYPPSFLYLVAILVLLSSNLYQSTQIYLNEQRFRELAQTVALLESKLERLEATETQRIGEDAREEIAIGSHHQVPSHH